MAANDVIVLNSILGQNKNKSANLLPDDEYFELFTFEQILKEYELDDDELTSGQIGGGDDGGIDGFFIFVNKININEDTDIEALSKNPEIELFLIQSKQSSSFSESAVEHVIATSKDIFNLEKDISDVEKFYNSILIDKVNIFRHTYLYLFCAKMMKEVDLFISSTIANQCNKKDDKQWFHSSTLRYISFHLAMLIIVKLTGKNDYKLKDVENLLEIDLNSNSEIMNQTLSELIELTNVYVGSRQSVSISTLSKQKEFVKYLLDNINCSLG